MKLPEIVGVAGTNASGKDTLGHLRARLNGAQMVSLSDILRAELDKRGLEHERANLRAVGNELRTAEGAGVLAKMTIERYRAGAPVGITITSIRNPAEAEEIKKAGGIVLWVDADRELRYRRILARETGRPEDKKSFDQFVAEEEAEMHPQEGEAGLNMAGVRDIADVTVINEYDSLDEYEAYLTKEFELLG